MSNVLIILTSTVKVNLYKHFLYQTDSNERIACYLKSIKQWLEKTNFKICVIENSGYEFSELNEYLELYKDRFEFISFNEFDLPSELQHLIYNNSKGASEMYSIIRAYNNSKFRQSINFIIKITARYFVPQLEPFLLENNIFNNSRHIGIKENKDMIIGLRQNNNLRCEILGIHKKFFDMLFELNLTDDNGHFYPHVESVYCNRLKLLNQDKILDCPPFEIESTQMGGVSLLVTEL